MEENIRAPLAARRLNLSDPYNGESLESYARRIRADNTIDNDMKEIMIQSRREYLGLDQDFSTYKLDNEIIIRANKIYKITELFTLNPNLKIILAQKLDKFVSMEIDLIKLEPPEYLEVFTIIDKSNFDNETYDYFNKLIIPYDLNQLQEYKTVLEITKRENEEKIAKNAEIEIRKNNINIFNQYVFRLSTYDQSVKSLSQSIDLHIQKYIGLETEYVILDSELKNQLKKFISSIRVKNGDSVIISQLFRIDYESK